MTHFLAVQCMLCGSLLTHTHTHTDANSCRAGLFGASPRSCYEISLGKQRGPRTGHRHRNRERKRVSERLSSPDKIPLFICTTVSLSRSIHPFLSALPFRSLQKPKGPQPTKAHSWGQGCVSLTVKSPHDLEEALHQLVDAVEGKDAPQFNV